MLVSFCVLWQHYYIVVSLQANAQRQEPLLYTRLIALIAGYVLRNRMIVLMSIIWVLQAFIFQKQN